MITFFFVIGAFVFGFWLAHKPGISRDVLSTPDWHSLRRKLVEIETLIGGSQLGVTPDPLNEAHRIVGECQRMLVHRPLERRMTVDQAVESALGPDEVEGELEHLTEDDVVRIGRQMGKTELGRREIEAAIGVDHELLWHDAFGCYEWRIRLAEGQRCPECNAIQQQLGTYSHSIDCWIGLGNFTVVPHGARQ